MNRAFHIAGLSWMASAFLLVRLGLDPVLCALAGGVVYTALLAAGRMPLWSYAAAAAACVCAASFAVYDAAVVTPAKRFEGAMRTLRATVVGRELYSGYSRVQLKIQAQGAPAGLAGERVRLSLPAALDVSVGDVVECTLKLKNGGDRREQLYAADIRFEASRAGPFYPVGREEGFWTALAAYRAGIAANITRQLPGDEGDVLSAMVTGMDERIPPDLRYGYSRAGIAHLLAVSGLHLSVLAGMLDAVLRALRFRPGGRALLSIGAVLLFMTLTGFSPSVTRAGIMAILWQSAGLFGQEPDTLNSLGLALALILLRNPYAAFSPGLQLSYFATMGIAALSTPLGDRWSRLLFKTDLYTLEEARPLRFALISALSVTLGAGVFTAPLVCWYFGQISLVSPAVNLLVGPLAGAALVCGLLCGACGFFPALALPARALGLAAGVSVKWMNGVAEWAGSLRYAALPARGETAVLWMAACLLCGGILAACRAPRPVGRYAAVLSLLPLLAGLCAQEAAWGRTLELAAVRNGNAVAVACGKQGAVIGAPETTYAARSLRNFLRDHGVEQISLLVVERDDDFYGNPVRLLTGAFPTGAREALDRTPGFDAALFGQVHVRAEHGAEAVAVEAGGLRFIKAFRQAPYAADVLINAENEVVPGQGVPLKITDRYFGSNVVTLRMLPSDKEPAAGRTERGRAP